MSAIYVLHTSRSQNVSALLYSGVYDIKVPI